MSDDGTGDKRELSSSVSPIGKGSNNKRKYLSEFFPDKIDMPSLTEFPRYELLKEKLQNNSNDVGLLDGCNTALKEQKVNESVKDQWAHSLVPEFHALLSNSLHQTFKRAIQKMVELGYSKEIAERTFLKCGLYHYAKDPVLNAIEGALMFMSREKELETSGCVVFSDFDKLVEYTILEMVCVLQEVRSGLTVAEAIWALLVSDANLVHACVVNTDCLGKFSLQKMFGEGSFATVPSEVKSEAFEQLLPCLNNVHFAKSLSLTYLPNSEDSRVHEVAITGKETSVPVPESVGKSTGTGKDQIQNVTQGADMEETSGGCRNGSSDGSKREMLQQKTFPFEKSYKGRPKGAFRGKVTWASMGLDKPLKFPSASSGMVMKSTLSKITPSVGANSPLPEGNSNVSNISKSVSQATHTPGLLTSKGAVFALPAVNTKSPASSSALESESTLKTGGDNSGASEVPDCCAGIPYDESLGKYIPQDNKQESILRLASHVKGLQRELRGWTEWANEKVMQTTQRLSKDQVELKMLKQEKEEAEKFKKDKQSSEENTLKRLSEMEYALTNATNQIEIAKSTIHSLENENSVLQMDVEAAKKRAFEATTNLEEALLREQEALKKFQAMDKLKVSLQEEFTTLRHHTADQRHQLERAGDRNDQLEALWKQEEREKEKLIAQAEDVRKETEQQKTKTKAEEDCMREVAESNSQNCNQHIKKLENEISQLRLVSESSKIAALLGGVDLNYGRSLIGRTASACQEFQVPKVNKSLVVFQNSLGHESVKPERECVMCLTEEMSVVFFPCAHQVLCAECNVLHEKQGMNDCPSCRTPIQERIYVRFADSQQC